MGIKSAETGVCELLQSPGGRDVGVDVGDAVQVCLEHQAVAGALEAQDAAGLRGNLFLPLGGGIVCRTGPEAPLAVTHYGVDIDAAVEPCGVVDLASARGAYAAGRRHGLGVQQHHGRASRDGIFGHRQGLLVGRVSRVEIAGTMGQGAHPPGLEVVRTNHRPVLQLPAGMGDNLAPYHGVAVLGHQLAGITFGGKRANGLLATGRVNLYQLAHVSHARLDGSHAPVAHRHDGVISGIVAVFGPAQAAEAGIRGTLQIVFFPHIGEVIDRAVEILAASTACVLLVGLIEDTGVVPVAGVVVIYVADHIIIGIVTHEGLHDIPEGIFVGDMMVVRIVAVDIVVVRQARKEIGPERHQEVGVSAAARVRKVGLGVDGVALELPSGGVEAHSQPYALLSEEIFEHREGACGEMGALAHMAPLMHRELMDPVVAISAVERGCGVDVQPARGPNYRGVAGEHVRMEYYGHVGLLYLESRLHPRTVDFEIEQILPGQGIEPHGVYDAEILRFDDVPAGRCRVVAQSIILRPRTHRHGDAQQRRKYYPVKLHRENSCKLLPPGSSPQPLPNRTTMPL